MHQVRVIGERPDYRVFADLLFGSNCDFDSEGDAHSPCSRTWTWLYLRNRESDNASHVEIESTPDDPTLFTIESANAELEIIASLYLLQYCGSALLSSTTRLDADCIATLSERFRTQLHRATLSRWHRSSPQNPYPPA